MRKLCESMKEESPEEIDNMEKRQLIDNLREYLIKKRYLVVFDDVRAIQFWERINPTLPENEKGSKILITTHSSDVASSCTESPIHIFNLQHLPLNTAWELFCKWAFQSNYCPKELEKLCSDTTEKCQGLPLAIMVVADGLRSKLKSNRHLASATRILYLSYHDLPYFSNLVFCTLASSHWLFCSVCNIDSTICC